MPPDLDAEQIIARIDAAIRELELLRRQISTAIAPFNPQPVAIGGWLKGYRFTSEDIAQARAEMWPRF
jgi:hypothetical protein